MMKKLYFDLHIHSNLSACASSDMTPGNIVGMAKLKGLDVISITDHNSCQNLESAIYQAKKFDIIVIPGMELETNEQIHFVCLFPNLDNAKIFENQIRKTLPNIKNNEKIFGEQWVYDKNDIKIKKEEQLLLCSADISLHQAIKEVSKLDGIIYPAHIDRDSMSIISALGTIPNEYKGKIVELSKNCIKNDFIEKNNICEGYKFIYGSDAHYLKDIFESDNLSEIAQFMVAYKDISSIFETLND